VTFAATLNDTQTWVSRSLANTIQTGAFHIVQQLITYLLNTFAARSIFPQVPSWHLGKNFCKKVLQRCQLVTSYGAGVRLSYMYWMTSTVYTRV